MSPELDKQICERFPKICINRSKGPRESCFHWGFQHSDGWRDLVDNLCGFIQRHIDSCAKWGKPIEQVVFSTVKEKYGVLRIYYDGGDDVIRGAVDFAEFLSGTICEECGSTEEVKQTKGYIQTLCKKHRIKKKFEID